ncbi:Amn1p LALA0_S04e04214g [Lachancea lanzarotensis]|uniref:LALA0S04e04214g1_1 n=1 Tax=Lachancea lanzarotensis TaxID=1245769 RepID=A0A0C7MWH0_9SACH|nr:uncharacterized protein LALA0_S04e04214g [Lachancea lanzarotensis]CEP61945.1 LALA0S04e04214g1_1 [Lachancea lanzarotensis]
MLPSDTSLKGSFKRSREISDSNWTCKPPSKKSSSVTTAYTADSHSAPKYKSGCDSPITSLKNLTPLATPTKNSPSFEDKDNFGRYQSSSNLETHFSDLKLCIPNKSHQAIFKDTKIGYREFTANTSHPIFRTAEIVDKILRFVDSEATIPREKTRHRRKPQAFSHALLLCDGDEARAKKMWNECNRSSAEPAVSNSPRLHSCIQVNKMWHRIALSIITENLYFTDSKKIRKLAGNVSKLRNRLSKPSAFVLHKLSKLEQTELNAFIPIVSSERLKWLEFYICPKIIPPIPLFYRSQNLEKLVLPGNQFLDDKFLMTIAPYLTKLKILDLRACDKISDCGVLSIAANCPNLKICNLGRHRNGKAITSVSMVALARNTKVDTVGVAGCHITDAGVWELALHLGPRIRRLSLNNCQLLTDNSVPTLLALGYFPQLSVLEIRNLDRLTNVLPIVNFVRSKRSQGIPLLVEGGERIDSMMIEAEHRLDQQESAHILAAFTDWVNEDDML